ncbi:MAG: hypothetical protein R3D03_21510 [Geminicoccaceae bacterium]
MARAVLSVATRMAHRTGRDSGRNWLWPFWISRLSDRHDIVQYARSQGILCQGRGSAANSILCYLLGITDVSPDMIGMVFERFVSRYRGEPPDIDVDFERRAPRRVIQWIL